MEHRTAADALRERVDDICAANDDDLAGKAWLALSKVLTAHVTAARSKKRKLSIIQRTIPGDVQHFLHQLRDANT